ncbi:MAG: hypothetical protein KBG20_14520 [Caldilineaceae bacterium]|nr:hypothetical protein [Caldilineaceae bacterium]MBP8108360.1 hypothetical protein [Caldilineaceae bacterium]MBP8123285.1 hypothetical protein [Caldilineaceae bacterium]MBP9073517.1 hypothetical protein [Caldilineaceae bacterium]
MGEVMDENPNDNIVSSGHKLGQLIGDWAERYFVLPLLQKVADELSLFLDSRFVDRPVRGEKILWPDADGNHVDYDFVLELNGTPDRLGIPVAFIESFWRRGIRHAKDKARDDSGKLVPMREAYPAARFLGIIAIGAFSRPAISLVHSREIDLLYVPKDKLVKAFAKLNLVMDYPDTESEQVKQAIATTFSTAFTLETKLAVAEELINQMGRASISSYVDRVRSKLAALPQEFRFIQRLDSQPVVFDSIDEATAFLAQPQFSKAHYTESYVYQVIYSDGSEFERTIESVSELRLLHGQIVALADHMNHYKST